MVVIGWITKAVLALLVGLSFWSIKVMLERLRAFRDQRLVEEVRQALEQSKSASKSVIEARFSAQVAEHRARLEQDLTILGSLGSSAPFIGLFGTVLGVIQAFGALSSAQGGMGPVMAAIAEALIATAVGLFVAIPALLAYNFFARKLRNLLTEAEILRDRFLAENGK